MEDGSGWWELQTKMTKTAKTEPVDEPELVQSRWPPAEKLNTEPADEPKTMPVAGLPAPSVAPPPMPPPVNVLPPGLELGETEETFTQTEPRYKHAETQTEPKTGATDASAAELQTKTEPVAEPKIVQPRWTPAEEPKTSGCIARAPPVKPGGTANALEAAAFLRKTEWARASSCPGAVR